MEADCKTAIYSKQLGGLQWPSLRCIIVFRMQNAYVMYTVCVRSAILLVQPVNPKLRFFVHESKTWLHAQKRSTSETRRSFHGWCWHPTLGLGILAAISFPDFHCRSCCR